MAADKEDFLRRWSRLKKETPAEKPVETPKPELPSIDQLTSESDFSGFMHPKVEDALRRVALKKLFRGDPHFNLPDPFEPYSGDWTVGEAIPDEMMATLNQARTHLFGDKQEEKPKTEEVAAPQPAEAVAANKPAEGAVEAKTPAPEQPTPDEPRKQDA